MAVGATPNDPDSNVRAHDISVRVEAGGKAAFVLDGIALTLVPHELVALVGPNGSGKSTLLRSLSRILKPHKGFVFLGDRDLYSQIDARSAARQIGVVPQDTHIAFEFTVREIVGMGRAPHRQRMAMLRPESAADRRAVEAALTRAGVPDTLFDRQIASLSGGERQRVLVARALAQEARILLLDEPTASLDIRHERRLLGWLRDLVRGEDRIVLVVLHDLNLAAQYADRVIIMDHGRIVAHGAPAEALTAERIQAVYGTPVWVRTHPVNGRPYLLNLPGPLDSGSEELAALAGKRIHLLGGGGTAAPLLMRLAAAQAKLTLGALNLGDTDQEAAALLGVAHAVAPPFSVLPDAAVAEGVALGTDADAVVMCEAPFGDGNLGTLRAAVALSSRGIPTILVSESTDLKSGRDFTTEHAACALWADLLAMPSVRISTDPAEALLAALAEPTQA